MNTRDDRRPVLDPVCVGGCGRSIDDDSEWTDPTVFPDGWTLTEQPGGYYRARCPDCRGAS
jgi:hypothetical protein